MENAKKATGKLGETAACEYLSQHGHLILERNWRCGHLEVDIITLDRAGVHFVEVKTRRPPLHKLPEESVDWKKQKFLATAAASYMKRNKARLGDAETFFDIISVVILPDATKIEYFPQAFIPLTFGR